MSWPGHDSPGPWTTLSASPSQLRSYTRYWRRACERFGELRLDQVRASDIIALQRRSVVFGRNSSRGGR